MRGARISHVVRSEHWTGCGWLVDFAAFHRMVQQNRIQKAQLSTPSQNTRTNKTKEHMLSFLCVRVPLVFVLFDLTFVPFPTPSRSGMRAVPRQAPGLICILAGSFVPSPHHHSGPDPNYNQAPAGVPPRPFPTLSFPIVPACPPPSCCSAR